VNPITGGSPKAEEANNGKKIIEKTKIADRHENPLLLLVCFNITTPFKKDQINL
jgi:hypothetical protein